MTAEFTTSLDVEMVSDTEDTWRLKSPLVFQSGILGTITVPVGFETDFASVPRVPLAFWLCGDTAERPAVVHDYLYGCADVTREQADDVLYEAMAAVGVPWWRRVLIYRAVRLFAGSHKKDVTTLKGATT
jgi:hypothetical protein